MNIHETAKLNLGRQWLGQIRYDPEWTTAQLQEALRPFDLSKEALGAVAFTLRNDASACFAEASALTNEQTQAA